MRSAVLVLTVALLAVRGHAQPPLVTVTRDDTVLDRSCRVRIPAGLLLDDVAGDGVIRIGADDVTIEFEPGSELRGAPFETPGPKLRGTGIAVSGYRNVTLRGARLRGYALGIDASDAEGLVIEDADLREIRRDLLDSTGEEEVPTGVVDPLHGDTRAWILRDGAGIAVRDSSHVTIRRTIVRSARNGIVLDRVRESKIYDTDASFLPGFGIALRRSSDNTVSRNALDFCVRSASTTTAFPAPRAAGLLLGDQCCRNVVAENSITHGGTGILCLPGAELLESSEAVGNNSNVFLRNDCSDAQKCGLDLRFTFDNRVLGNRFARVSGMALDAGYSQRTLILGNRFESNGTVGAPGGALAIEHGTANRVQENSFSGNTCAIDLRDDDDPDILGRPWARANHKGSLFNVLVSNHCEKDAVGIRLRNTGKTTSLDNTMDAVGEPLSADEGSTRGLGSGPVPPLPKSPAELSSLELPGTSTPVGARKSLEGRASIRMTATGPWDHETPFVRLRESTPDADVYEVFNAPDPVAVGFLDPPMLATLGPRDIAGVRRLTVRTLAPGGFGYRVPLECGGLREDVRGTIVNTRWSLRFFKWTRDPREDPAGFLAEGRGPGAIESIVSAVDLRFGTGGPSSLGLPRSPALALIPADGFGTIAETVVVLKAGRWKVATRSDEGVRVTVDDRIVIDHWDAHADARDSGEFAAPEDRAIRIRVEHYDLDGPARLRVDLEALE